MARGSGLGLWCVCLVGWLVGWLGNRKWEMGMYLIDDVFNYNYNDNDNYNDGECLFVVLPYPTQGVK